ncbi:hypothetical protein Naga_100022g60 [Nannochloropsis gaditana]|uniref:Uncharacterized protein n=1 Tax=Nannochloropsis gaditana TaxID=72520 RepID=W7UAC8_9STRA|nr:hypothetical protein Naga_100022g60 [Nannochloropsis gaditana]
MSVARATSSSPEEVQCSFRTGISLQEAFRTTYHLPIYPDNNLLAELPYHCHLLSRCRIYCLSNNIIFVAGLSPSVHQRVNNCVCYLDWRELGEYCLKDLIVDQKGLCCRSARGPRFMPDTCLHPSQQRQISMGSPSRM